MAGDLGQLSSKFKQRYDARREERISFDEYFDRCKADPQTYDSVHGRLLRAIGKPVLFDTQRDERLGRIFQNQTIRMYPTFDKFYGIERAIEELVTFIERASKGGEGEKQVCYLLGPVGSGKSSLVERVKELFQTQPFYALVDEAGVLSPIFESPLGIFCDPEDRAMLESEYKIDPRFVPLVRSRWLQIRLAKNGGDFTKFRIAKLYPSIVDQIGIAETVPADENTQDVSTLVGKTDIRVLDELAQSHPDSYVYSGALCASVQGVLDFVEMFKAPIKMLHPLITATQEHRFEPSERIGALPYNGLILAHSNEGEWDTFKNNRDNEALLSRITLIRVPYCLRISEEEQIYRKKIDGSAYKQAPCAPGTLELMAKLSVLSRLEPYQGGQPSLKMRVYDGENLHDKDINAKPIHEYREAAGVEEGMKGIDTRFAYKTIERAYEYDPTETSANPVTLLRVLEEEIRKEKFPKALESKYLEFLKDPLEKELFLFVGGELREAYFSTLGGEFAQNLFERYFWLADHWIDNKDYRDPKTGTRMNKKDLDKELEKIEKPAGIANPKDFRNEVVRWVLKNKSGDRLPDRKSFPKLNEAVEKAAFPSFEEFLPIFARKAKGTTEQVQKYNAFVEAMVGRGYTPAMVELLGEWWQRKHAGG